MLVEGLSKRRVAKELGVIRNMVRTYVEQSEPAFRKPGPRRQPVMERVRPRLQELVDEWSTRTTRKQRILATRLHRQLITEGFDVGETPVRMFFQEGKRKP